MNIPKPTKLSFKVTPQTDVRFSIEYDGVLTNTNRLKTFKNFVSRENPKRVSFIVSKNTSFFEPSGILNKEIRSSDPQADKFLNIFITDNKKAKPKKLYFFREDGTEISMTKAIKKGETIATKLENTSNNFILFALILGGITIAVLSDKRKKR